jgi:hypothetical protein
MTWFKAQQVSVTTNSTIVTVVNATSDDIALVQEAGGLVIGNNQPVEVKRGFLQSGNKRIELAKPWPYANQTNQIAVVFPTDAALRDATEALKNSGVNNVTYAQGLTTVLNSTANTVTVGTTTVVPRGKLQANYNAKLATMSALGQQLYVTDSQNHGRNLIGVAPAIPTEATLDLDFAKNHYRVFENSQMVEKPLSEILTTTRASDATLNTPFGVATVGSGVARLEFDPSSGESLGLLCEEQRTNLLLNSATLSTQSVTVTSVSHTISFTGTGSITLSGAATGTLNGSALTRQSLTFNPTAGSLTITVTGQVLSAQLEAGSVATSYIPTTGTQITRALDSYTIPSNLHKQSSGVFFIDAKMPKVTNFNTLLGLGNGTTEEIRIGANTSTGQSITTIIRSGDTQAISGTELVSMGDRVKVALRYTLTSAGVVWSTTINGIRKTDITTITFPTNFFTNPIRVGARRSNSSDLFWNSTVYALDYYPYALSDEQLIELTRI